MTDKAMMVTKAKNIYIMLLHAISKENMSIVDHYLDDKLTQQYTEMIENYKKNNVKQLFRQPNISQMSVLNETNDSITFQAEVRYITYFVNRKNNKFASGDDKTRITKKVTLKFKKSNNTDRTVIHCPDCGAALNINASAICTYCGIAVDERFSDLVLYSIT